MSAPPPPPSFESQAAWLGRFLLALGIILGVAAALLVIWQAAGVLLLAFGGVLLAVLLRGCSRALHRTTRLPMGLSLAVVVVVLLTLLTSAVLFLAPSMARQTRDLQVTLLQTFTRLQATVSERYFLEPPPPEPPAGATPGVTVPLAPDEQETLQRSSSFDSQFRPDVATVRDLFTGGAALVRRLAGLFSTAFGVLAAILIVLLVGVFFAADPQTYRDGFLRFLPVERRARVAEVLDEAEDVLRWWMIGQSVSMVTVGVLITLGLWLLGVPVAPALGLLAALFTFVPYLGPIVSSIPGLLIAWSVSPTVLLYTFLLYVAVQNLEGWVLTPLVQQKAVRLPPALIVSSQMLAGIVWGVLGIVFATPLVAAAKLLIRRLYMEDVLRDSFEKPAVRSER
jgi:predicted PurR-regulated permease PerM